MIKGAACICPKSNKNLVVPTASRTKSKVWVRPNQTEIQEQDGRVGIKRAQVRNITTEIASLDMQALDKQRKPARAQPENMARSVNIIAPCGYLKFRDNKTQMFYALIDTGAELNVISEEVLKKIAHKPLMDYSVNIAGYGGSKGVANWYLVRLEFPNERTMIVPVVVGELKINTLLLGMPFLTQAQAIINIRKRIIHTSKGTFSLSSKNQDENQQEIGYRLMLMESFSLSREEIANNPQIQKAFENTLLSTEGKAEMIQILQDYQNVWTQKGVGAASGVEHEIVLTSYKPVALPPRHIPLHLQEALDKEVNQMLEDGVISPSSSPYATYPVMVLKPDGGIRLAIDYRRLNNLTVTDAMPLPNIRDLLYAIEGSKYFTLIDLRAGFWQIPMAENSKHLTAFRTHRGHYQFNVMPFGLKNAPATFQRWTNDLFKDLRYKGVLVYLDDILIHAKLEPDFLKLSRECFERLDRYHGQVQIKKCKFAQAVTNYLGHCIEQGIRRPNINRVEPLFKIRDPVNLKEVRSILGKFGYYRDYIKNFAEKTVPLTRLLRKGAKFEWTLQMREIIQSLAQELATAVLQVGTEGSRFRIEADASETALGGVLYNEEEYQKKGKRTLPILFMSKTLNPTEAKWENGEREAYAIIWALEQSDAFIRGRPVTVYSDHQNLQWMMTKKKGKIARWCSRLSEYQVEIKHISGGENQLADFLSRMVREDPLQKSSMYCYVVQSNDTPNILVPKELLENIWSRRLKEEMLNECEEDIEDNRNNQNNHQVQIPASITTNTSTTGPKFLIQPVHPTLDQIRIAQLNEAPTTLGKGFRVFEGRILYLTGIWVPPSLREQILDATHLSMPHWHPGERRMIKIIRRIYCWENLYKDIKKYLSGCITCQRLKPNTQQLPLTERTHPPSAPFDRIYIDFWGPVAWGTIGEHKLILTIIDNHTKWAEAIPVTDKNAETVARSLFINWIARFGAPKVMVSDNEPTFTSDVLLQLSMLFGIHHVRSTPYHPQGNALIETFHRTLKKTMSQLHTYASNQITLEEAIAWALLAYRSFPHSTVFESPSYLTHGIDLRYNSFNTLMTFKRPEEQVRLQVLGEIRQELYRKQQIISTKAIMQQENPSPKRRLFKIGDAVIKQLTPVEIKRLAIKAGGNKLITPWSLPLRVTSISSNGYRGQLTCPRTNEVVTAYIDKVKFIQLPQTTGQRLAWERELTNQDRFLNPFNTNTEALSQRGKRCRTNNNLGEVVCVRGLEQSEEVVVSSAKGTK